ncbi:hypothetical protein CVT26_010524 [Gymnopilus dilepis]|uniref:Heme haloperoxidase family profile domain-containing protein n=1 Tax=Gymnopilus dilepis TaxID=231916 RepID=A0A409W534_9AGAR|nr:hypothetical protein CVT26_010524 [Gymnopilus dilepis]
MFLVTPLYSILQNVVIFTLDFIFVIINFVTPQRKVGHVTPEGHPGAGGIWPEYIAPKKGDSRCSCPALNTMANHGIIPRDGKNVKFSELAPKIRTTYNFAPTLCFFVPNYAAKMLNKSYDKDTFDLSDLDLHNGIEHDASLTRKDSALVPDQGKPHTPFVEELLALATTKDKDGNLVITAKDLSNYSSKRRVDSQVSNPHYHLDVPHKVFGSANSSTLLNTFGGRVSDLDAFLREERLPQGWESRVRKRMGLTFADFNSTALKVELGINEKKYKAKLASTTKYGSTWNSQQTAV